MTTSYEDLRAAIEKNVLVRSSSGVRIISDEEGGLAEWLFDFRALLLQPKWLDRYAEIFWERYADRYPFQICAMESAGISLVAAIVMKSVERGTPVNGFFARKSRKRKGLTKIIEGVVTDDPIIMVDDLINSGDTVAKLAQAIPSGRAGKKEFFALLSFRERSAYDHLRSRGIEVSTIFTLEDFGIPLLTARLKGEEPFEIRWKFGAKDPSYHFVIQKSAPVLDDTRIYTGSDAGTFYALEQSDGSVAWEFNIGKHPPGKGIFSSPALHGNAVFFGAYDGNVYALDTKTGAKKWQYGKAEWIGSSPAVAAELGLLFVGLEFGLFRKRGGIAALDIATGKERWSDTTAEFTHSSPLFIPEESLVVIGSNDGVLYAYDARSGERKWIYQSRGDIKTRAAYDAKRRLVVFASMDGNVYAIEARDGSVVFAFETGAGIYSTPLIVGEIAYVTSLDKTIYAIDLGTGKARAEFETAGRIFATPMIFEGSIWIGSNDGKLYELAPETLKLRSSFQFSERIVNQIAYNKATKRLFVPTVANEIYCLERKKSE